MICTWLMGRAGSSLPIFTRGRATGPPGPRRACASCAVTAGQGFSGDGSRRREAGSHGFVSKKRVSELLFYDMRNCYFMISVLDPCVSPPPQAASPRPAGGGRRNQGPTSLKQPTLPTVSHQDERQLTASHPGWQPRRRLPLPHPSRGLVDGVGSHQRCAWQEGPGGVLIPLQAQCTCACVTHSHSHSAMLEMSRQPGPMRR